MLMSLLLWILIIILVLPFYIIGMIICGIYRIFVNLIVWAFHPELVAHLTSRDIVFTSDDFEGKVRKNLMDLAIVEGHVDLNDFRKEIYKRIFSKPFYQRLNCRPVIFMGYYFWKLLDYKLESQIIEYGQEVTRQELKTIMPKWSAEPYNKNGPLWSILVVRLVDGCTAFGCKIHHMNGDGACFMKLIEDLVDPDPGYKKVDIKETRPLSWLHWIYAWYNFPWVTLQAYRLAGTRKGFRPQAISGEGFSSWTHLPSHKIKTIRRLAKCTFSTVLAGILSNAFYKLLLNSGKSSEIPKIIRLVVPVPWPNRPKRRMSNHVAFVHGNLTLGEGLSDFYEFESSIKKNYISGMHGVVWSIFRGMYVAPSFLLHRYTEWGERKLPPVIFSSVPGPQNEVFLMGHRIQESISLFGLGCTTGVNCTITSCGLETTMSIRVSAEIIPTQELMDELVDKYLHEELEFYYQKVLEEENNKTQQNKDNQINIEIS